VCGGGSLIRIDLSPSASLFAFLVCSVETEHESELKHFWRSSDLMYDVLSLRDEDIKAAIKWFNITCVVSFPFLLTSGRV